MKRRIPKKKKSELVPGTIIESQSGRYIAYYEHRSDIIANGENETDAKNNLRIMYDIVIKHEKAELEKTTLTLPKTFITKKFTQKMTLA